MQGFNMGRYIPPDLEGTSTTANQASGKGHALGRRAHKLQSHGILIVRFENPFAIWCTHCHPEQIIGQGVRFNAEKKSVGKYYSTTIWSFRFKHSVCGGWIEVRTDPKNSEYVVVEGGRRRDYGSENHLWFDADSLGPQTSEIGLPQNTEEEKQRLENDGGFGRLEKKIQDKNVFDSNQKRLDELTDLSHRQWKDPYQQSQKLRAEFRVGRRKRQKDEKTGNELRDRYGLMVEMVPENQEDVERARLVDFGVGNDSDELARGLMKPLFNRSGGHEDLDSHQDSSKRKGGKISSAQRIEEQKSNLQARLQGNTRGVIDPFVRDTAHWQRKIKRRRDETDDEGSNTERLKPLPDKNIEEKPTSTSAPNLALDSYDSD